MTERKWTPGPWKASHVATIWNSDESDEIADVWDRDRGIDEAQANAHLIAAAPDLYEALDVMLQQWVELSECGDAGYWDANQDASVIQARAALAKARGEK